jgi:hypothetical protein
MHPLLITSRDEPPSEISGVISIRPTWSLLTESGIKKKRMQS